jgi:hypothetical protein
MNVSRLITGIILLAIAVLLTVLNFVLPPEKLMFMIGDANMPLVPAIILGIVAVWFIATAGRAEKAPADKQPVEEVPTTTDPEKVALNKRLETMGWGLFLIMLGGFSFVPHELVAQGVWSMGVGVIMLGLNAARYYNGIKMSGFTTFLGLLSVLTGITELLGFVSLDGAFFLIILGAYLILKPWFDKHQLFGKVA